MKTIKCTARFGGVTVVSMEFSSLRDVTYLCGMWWNVSGRHDVISKKAFNFTQFSIRVLLQIAIQLPST